MKSYFINEAFEKAITDYLKSEDAPEGILYNSFLVVVIRMLVNIYGELDIINPFEVKNENAFDDNLMKFGATIEKVDELKRLVDGFYNIEKRNKKSIKKETNCYFISVQKCLIDLYTLKRINYGLTQSDHKEFYDLLYTPGCSNALRLSYNYLNADDIYEVAEYFKECMKQDGKKEEKKEKNILGFDVYKMFNLSVADISKLSVQELDKINSEIYASLDIKENAINKDYLLKEKINRIKLQNEPLTTGNGYVDILLVMSVIVTSIMVVVIVGTLVF